MTDLLLGIETLILLVLAPLTIGSAWYLNRIYRRSASPRVPLFRALVTNVKMAALVGSYFAYVIVARVVSLLHIGELPVFPIPWSTIVAAAAIIVLMVPTVIYAMTVRKMRRPWKGNVP